MTIRPHDFSRPPSLHPDTRTRLVQWMTRTNSQLAEVLAGNSLEVEVELSDCSTAWPLDDLNRWPDKTVAFRIKLADSAETSVIALSNPLAQVLVGSLLGEVPQEWPQEREFTPSELSVAEFLVNRFTACMIDCWSGDAPLELKVTESESNLRRTKLFRFSEPMIVSRTTIKMAIGSGQMCWMLPHEYLTRMFGSVRKTQDESDVTPREQLETLAREMATQVTIRLGGVQLSAPQLAELRVGDLVVLNQKTSEPLRAMISGQTRFLGWPGRVGNRQAFEIAVDGPRRDRQVEAMTPVPVAAGHS